jgi:hypothetical protein
MGKLFTANFLQAAVAGPILGIDFLRKFKISVAPETSQVLFACTAMAPAPAERLPPIIPLVAEPSFVQSKATTSLMQSIPDHVPDDVKRFLLRFLSILRTGDVVPTQPIGCSTTFTQAAIHRYSPKLAAWIPPNLQLQKQNSNV